MDFNSFENKCLEVVGTSSTVQAQGLVLWPDYLSWSHFLDMNIHLLVFLGVLYRPGAKEWRGSPAGAVHWESRMVASNVRALRTRRFHRGHLLQSTAT